MERKRRVSWIGNLTLRKYKRLEAFELWAWNMEHISWMDHKTNECVLSQVKDLPKEKIKPLNTILERKSDGLDTS